MNKETIKDKFFNLLHRIEVDKAVFYSLLGKICNFIAVPVNFLLIARYFSRELQGYYYTFASLLTFQFLLELGLGRVIIQFASHEWSGLSIDQNGHIQGNQNKLSRLQSLAQFAFRWYAFAALLLTIGLMAGGYLFFLKVPSVNIDWVLPWLALSILNGVSFVLIPVWSMIEGCNQVGSLYKYRFVQSVCSNLALWLAILLGAKLWTTPIATLTILLCAGMFVMFKYKFFLKKLFFSRPLGHRIVWREEIWPLQWRVMLTWLIGPFATALFVPILFRYHGPVVAGQAGMTISLIGTLSTVTSAWIYPKMPLFGILISERKYDQLDRLFWKITKIVAGIAVIGAFAIFITLFTLNKINHPLSARFLPPFTALLFLIPHVLIIFTLPMASYLRAHKKEPLVVLSTIEGALIGLLTLTVGRSYGALGIGIGYFSVYIITIPLVVIIWHRCRNEWHGDELKNAA